MLHSDYRELKQNEKKVRKLKLGEDPRKVTRGMKKETKRMRRIREKKKERKRTRERIRMEKLKIDLNDVINIYIYIQRFVESNTWIIKFIVGFVFFLGCCFLYQYQYQFTCEDEDKIRNNWKILKET